MDDPYAQLKQGARVMWGLGDYRRIAEALVPEAEWLVDAAGVAAGTAVCDVAAGTGNLAVAAAERGARVSASDFSPQMVAWGRDRTETGGLDVAWHEADAEDLPFDDGTFDVVASAFGAMFAPRPEVTTAELFRVAAPGGTVAMANWSAEGFSGQTSALLASFGPTAPAGLPSPMAWGDPDEVRRRFAGHAVEVRTEARAATFRFGSVGEALAFFEANTGGYVILERMLPPARYAAFREGLEGLVRAFAGPEDGGVRIDNAYLAVIARKG
jgi:2-polyprenyl-6-hydroxyphenyl methylase/3-demethylubiquinone-9 3-methyltransferase